MSNEITTAFVQQYKANVALLLQQRGSKLAGALMTGTSVGKAGKVLEQIGPVVAQKRTSRHADTPLIETPHAARWAFPSDYEWADLIDDQDKLRTLIDPQSPYAVNGAYALGRAKDDEIIAAFFGTAKTGEDGDVDEAFDTATYQIAVGGAGLTVGKLRTAKRLLMAAEVDVDNDPLYVAIGATQHDNLLGETQAVSLDFTDKPVLVDGRIRAFMGFNFIDCNRLGLDGSGDRRCPAWAKSGMHLEMWNDINTQISDRPDKSHATQVYVKGTYGATRLEQGKIIEIICDE